MWRDDIDKIEPVIEHIPKAVEKRYILSTIAYGPRFGTIKCAKETFFELIGRDLCDKYLKIGRMFWPFGDEVIGWKTHLHRPEFYIQDLFVWTINKTLKESEEIDILKNMLKEKPIYTSIKYRFILREDIYDKIKNLTLKDCHVFEFNYTDSVLRKIKHKPKKHDIENDEEIYQRYLNELKIQKGSSFEKLNYNELKSFQSKAAVKFPSQYEKYQLKFNGGFPKENVVCPDLHGDFCIYQFYGIDKEEKISEKSLGYYLRLWRRFNISDEMIPIADNGTGDYLCIGIREDKIGKIFHWRHEEEEFVCIFNSFFEMLKSRTIE